MRTHARQVRFKLYCVNLLTHLHINDKILFSKYFLLRVFLLIIYKYILKQLFFTRFYKNNNKKESFLLHTFIFGKFNVKLAKFWICSGNLKKKYRYKILKLSALKRKNSFNSSA